MNGISSSVEMLVSLRAMIAIICSNTLYMLDLPSEVIFSGDRAKVCAAEVSGCRRQFHVISYLPVLQSTR